MYRQAPVKRLLCLFRTAPTEQLRVGVFSRRGGLSKRRGLFTLVCARQAHGIQILTIREFGTPGGAGSSEPLAESSARRVGAAEEAEEAGASMSAGGKAARGRGFCGGKVFGLGGKREGRYDLLTQAPVTAASMLFTSTGSISALFEVLRGVTSMLGSVFTVFI